MRKLNINKNYNCLVFLSTLIFIFLMTPISTAFARDYKSVNPPPDSLIIRWITEAKICAAALVGATFFPAESIVGLSDLGIGKYQVMYKISGGRTMDNVFLTRLNTNLWKISCTSTVRVTKAGLVQGDNKDTTGSGLPENSNDNSKSTNSVFVPFASPNAKILRLLGDKEWSGLVTEPNSTRPYSVVIHRAPSQIIVKYPELNCDGVWNFLKQFENTSIFREKILNGRKNCTDSGEVRLHYVGEGVIQFDWRRNSITHREAWANLSITE